MLKAMFDTRRWSRSAGPVDWLRSSIGALIGILSTGMICHAWLGSHDGLPLLVAPIGASAVLVFAVPASPLAQPWSLVGGNTLSALAGIACGLLINDPIYASAAAVSSAILVMRAARCLHPPGGATALTAVIGGPAIVAAGWSFALVPVALNSVILLAIAWLFNNATRHSYPHRAPQISHNPHDTEDPPPQDRVGYTAADIDTVLARYDELIDVSRDDLAAIFQQVEAQAHRRLHSEIRCERIMSRDVIFAYADEGIQQVQERLTTRHLNALPVVDAARRVLGVVGHTELLTGQGRTAGEVMRRSAYLAAPETPIDELLPMLSGGIVHEAIVTDGQGRISGIITQTDLLAALWRGHVAEQVAAGTKPDYAEAG
ncbi:HPP family protein [Hyphomicrobium sp.]|uniref:HPP family protein n=1 Tax=Hyphomicrobium sp. TaxID=82 RepID=UPI002E3806C0|nr:HPP family protein [Hyphomicrobium sp.]HEX2843202.1 HPP family protein [Hyphomicrobium sp.]